MTTRLMCFFRDFTLSISLILLCLLGNSCSPRHTAFEAAGQMNNQKMLAWLNTARRLHHEVVMPIHQFRRMQALSQLKEQTPNVASEDVLDTPRENPFDFNNLVEELEHQPKSLAVTYGIYMWTFLLSEDVLSFRQIRAEQGQVISDEDYQRLTLTEGVLSVEWAHHFESLLAQADLANGRQSRLGSYIMARTLR